MVRGVACSLLSPVKSNHRPRGQAGARRWTDAAAGRWRRWPAGESRPSKALPNQMGPFHQCGFIIPGELGRSSSFGSGRDYALVSSF